MSKAPEDMSREELIAAYSKLQFEVKELNRSLFGNKSERFIAKDHGEGQMELPFKVEEKPVRGNITTEDISYTRKKKIRDSHPGRFPLDIRKSVFFLMEV